MTEHTSPRLMPVVTPAARPALLRLIRGGVFFLLALWMALVSGLAQAQLRLGDAPDLAPRMPLTRGLSSDLRLSGQPRTADFIVAVVDQDIITHQDVDKRVSRIIETSPAGTRMPSAQALRQQVLDALIDEKVQLAHARSVGMSVSDQELDAAVETIAAQNQISLSELRRRMSQDGLDYQRYRSSLHDQILLERVRAREVNARIQITDADLNAFNAKGLRELGETSYNIAHLLLPVPANASEQQIDALKARAEALRERAARGENFPALVREHSADDNTRDVGGSLGLRRGARLPDIFVEAVKNLAINGVGPVIRSNAGFHVLKLIERENSNAASYTQQRARHILVRTSPKLDTEAAVARLSGIRKRIVEGQSSFAQEARLHSEDGSARQGGDLGWAAPGQFVPEFEKALLALQPGEISQPVVSRFGVHLIQLIERREVELTEAQKREAARSVLREQRFEETYEEWARELRAAAWVEVRNAP